MKSKLVTIIIVNLNGKEFTKNCLISIKKNTKYKNYNIVVVDNNSTDGSQKLIKSKFKRVDLIENKSNRGFAGGNNDGIKYAIKKYNPDYFYLLNNDTLVEKNWLTEAIKTAEMSKKIGIVGSKQLNFEKKPSISAGKINIFGVKYYWGNKDKEVTWVSGAGMLIKKEVFLRVGFFDEIYNPAYYEETDLEKRAIQKGFKAYHSSKSIILHKGGATSKKDPENSSKLFYRNRFIYFVRNKGFIYFIPRIFIDLYHEIKREGIRGISKLISSYREGYRAIKK